MERRLARTLDQLELLEQRAARQELRLRLHRLSQEEQVRLLSPRQVAPPTPNPPPLPEPPSLVVEQPSLPVVHRPESLPPAEELEPMEPAGQQLLSLLESQTTTSSSSSSAV
jgi:hypothetical protein